MLFSWHEFITDPFLPWKRPGLSFLSALPLSSVLLALSCRWDSEKGNWRFHPDEKHHPETAGG
jgi:hypothetical protein